MTKSVIFSKDVPSIFKSPLKKKSKAKRQSISRSQKNEVLALQKNRCADCKEMLDMRATEFHHVREVHRNGKSIVGNLQALCANCHKRKTHKDNLKKVEKRRKEDKPKLKHRINPLTGKKEKALPKGSLWRIG